MRNGSASNYASDDKQDGYRKPVWDYFAQHVSGSPAMLLPSHGGSEIAEALCRGWREDQLYCVDRVPQRLALLRQGKLSPTVHAVPYHAVHTLAGSVVKAHDVLASQGVQLGALSLDFCTPVHWPGVCRWLALCSDADIWEDNAVVAIAVRRGREQRGIADWLHAANRYGVGELAAAFTPVGFLPRSILSGGDWVRIWALFYGLPRHIALPVTAWRYWNGGTEMLTLIVRMVKVRPTRSPLADSHLRQLHAWFTAFHAYLRPRIASRDRRSSGFVTKIPRWAKAGRALRGGRMDARHPKRHASTRPSQIAALAAFASNDDAYIARRGSKAGNPCRECGAYLPANGRATIGICALCTGKRAEAIKAARLALVEVRRPKCPHPAGRHVWGLCMRCYQWGLDTGRLRKQEA